ncbi:unnamed protein product [Kuraishia capsulata CBS 1993]|uniref:Uncharacterized protein n=1 Tax=Kuraishia capsulata CBS 1993 TaxID=1382522 RepID=W6MKX1_9ASCO|nr:uncharacterized protein KUCA_T00003028001 [Kuraishia capsulata CBS 1993]CDK27051.1 unnamed protein product [Kuraishia capsulata CBS 1993]
MFSRQLLRSTRAANGARFVSTSAITTKASDLASKTVYWSKVTAELAKEVYKKEGFAPPSVAEFQKVYESLYKDALKFALDPKAAVKYAKTIFNSLDKKTSITYGSYLVQILGLFSLGEIVGRRQLVGYPSFGPKEHHH